MTPVEALLHRASYRVEKLLKQRGNFNSVLWLTEHADGRRETFETWLNAAPEGVSDAEALAVLAEDTAADFADNGVVRFSCAYLANKTTAARPVEPTPLMSPATFRRPVIMIETHSHNEHWRAEREIIALQPRRPAVRALSALQPAADSIYARLLDGEYAELIDEPT